MEIGVRSGIVASRPAFEFEDTQSVPPKEARRLSDQLSSLVVEETVDGLYRCEATFNNFARNGSGFQYLDRKILDFGATFTVKATNGTEQVPIFKGRIAGIESVVQQSQAPLVTMLAEDRLQDLRMTRRTRTFEQTTDADVFRAIAKEHNLSAEGVQVDGPQYPVLAQVNQSDLAFLRDRARAIDAEVWVEDKALKVRPRASRDTSEVTLRAGRGLFSFRVLADVARQRTRYTVSGWDPIQGTSIVATVGAEAIQAEVQSNDGGAKVLRDFLGEGDRVGQEVHRLPSTEKEAHAIATSCFRQQARRFVQGEGEAEGDARMRVGTQVNLQGVGGLFDGLYTLTEVRHVFNETTGYRVHFCVERPFIA